VSWFREGESLTFRGSEFSFFINWVDNVDRYRKEIRKSIHIINHAIIIGNLAQIVKKATCLMTPTQYNSPLSLLNELCSKKEIIG